ncbi:MAG: hypothetical protein KJ043_23710, partial [Anaerolineae bacterium]|nr:hypothetical protein [Anaerolineae bacterium]
MQAKPTALSETLYNPNATRLRLAILIIASLLAIGAFVAYLILAITWRSQPFLGVMVNHTMTVNGGLPNGANTWNGLTAGLRSGDRLLAIDNTPIRSNTPETQRFTPLNDILIRRNVGERVTVTFDYNVRTSPDPRRETVTCLPADPVTNRAECSVTFRLGEYPDADFIATFITPYLSGVVVLLISFGLLYMRYKDPSAFVAILGNLGLALYMGGLFDLATSHTFDMVNHAAGIYVGAILVTMALIFPLKIGIIAKKSQFAFAPVVLATVIFGYMLIQYPNNPPSILTPTTQAAGIAIVMGMIVWVAALIFYHRRFSFT